MSNDVIFGLILYHFCFFVFYGWLDYYAVAALQVHLAANQRVVDEMHWRNEKGNNKKARQRDTQKDVTTHEYLIKNRQKEKKERKRKKNDIRGVDSNLHLAGATRKKDAKELNKRTTAIKCEFKMVSFFFF